MKNLLVMRHAKAVAPATMAEDFARPLSPRGREDAQCVGRVLAAHGPRPDLVLSSPAVRAAATAQAVAKAAGIGATEIRLEERLYAATAATLSEVVAAAPDSVGALLVVAHNPGLEEWLTVLCGGRVRLATAALAAVELAAADWHEAARGGGVLEWLGKPRLVRGR